MEIFTLSYKVASNTYIVFDPEDGQERHDAFVVDPGGNAAEMLAILEDHHLALRFILLTHGHFDHTQAVDALVRETGVALYIHEKDVPLLQNEKQSMAYLLGNRRNCVETLPQYLHDGDEIPFGKTVIRVLHTPGHTPGSVCYLMDGVMFSGDTLFAGTVGRTDFPGGDMLQMKLSLLKLSALPQNYRVLPGHMEETTLDTEKKTNSYFQEME